MFLFRRRVFFFITLSHLIERARFSGVCVYPFYEQKKHAATRRRRHSYRAYEKTMATYARERQKKKKIESDSIIKYSHARAKGHGGGAAKTARVDLLLILFLFFLCTLYFCSFILYINIKIVHCRIFYYLSA